MTRAYWTTLRSVDDSTGRLCDALRRAGELDRTVVLYTSDNGLLNGEHGMVDKRTMHEPSIRIPLVVRYPGLTPPHNPRTITQMTLTVDIAPTLLELCGVPAPDNLHGRSWAAIARGAPAPWRTSWLYEYNYERQFPYTPNVRGVRTDDWKLIRYPHGDGGPDRHRAELYHLAADPEERVNLIDDPRHAKKRAELEAELDRLLHATGALPDAMPLDEGVKSALPDLKIR